MYYRWLVTGLVLLLFGCSGQPPLLSGHSRGVVIWRQQSAFIPGQWDQLIRQRYKRLQQLSQIDAELVIEADATANAFARVDRQGVASVRLNAGLIDLVGYDLDALTFVLAHEIGHLKLDQLSDAGRQRLKRQDSAIDILSSVADMIIPFSSLVVIAGNEMFKAGYSRDQEREADRFGLELMTQAGFDPQGAVRFQQRLLLLSGDSSLDMLATHPSGAERVQTMQRLIHSPPDLLE